METVTENQAQIKQAPRYVVRTVGGLSIAEFDEIDVAKRHAFAYVRRDGGACYVEDSGKPFVIYAWDNRYSHVTCGLVTSCDPMPKSAGAV